MTPMRPVPLEAFGGRCFAESFLPRGGKETHQTTTTNKKGIERMKRLNIPGPWKQQAQKQISMKPSKALFRSTPPARKLGGCPATPAWALLWLFSGIIPALSQPSITKQPANQSVSLGATVQFAVAASSSHPPLILQWQFATTNLAAQTQATLVLTNILAANAGGYNVVATDDTGSVTSRVAQLTVNSTFSKVNTGSIVTDRGFSMAGAWADYNNDGFLDLFVYNDDQDDGIAYAPYLYRNDGNGTFTKVTSGLPVTVVTESDSGCWGDYDNDGNLDLFVATAVQDYLYHNNGDGTFTRDPVSPFASDRGYHLGSSWADYDSDGLLDLLVTLFDSDNNSRNALYHNTGEGTFVRVTNGVIATDVGSGVGCAWADYDNDGHLDLFVSGGSGPSNGHPARPNRLYHNNGDNTFTRITDGSIATDAGYSGSPVWGDYDNDGFLDLFVPNVGGLPNFLYHNNGNGTFTRSTNGPIATDIGQPWGAAWGDYDNDGFLDLFVSNNGTPTNSSAGVNFLYHNNGDGTFTRITTGSLANDPSFSIGVSWADYDNDGFLDLFVAQNNGTGNYLYHNNGINSGNTNAWLEVNPIGRLSNRSAIGARVRVKATIGGVSRWQLRQITGGVGPGAPGELRAHFGLGNASNVDQVVIQWPSGVVQTLTNVAPRQILTVVERQSYTTLAPPTISSATRSSNGIVSLTATGDANMLYLFEGSTNLVNWTWLGVVSNAIGSVQFTDTHATNYASRFYRVSIP